MGSLICIIGNCGSGKTTFTKLICTHFGFTPYLEQHAERPFHTNFYRQTQYALANQIDFLLSRAEQELTIRQLEGTGVQDGGLEQDYYIFTHLFYDKGLLSKEDFALCSRTYNLLRKTMPMPDLFIYLSVDVPTVAQRRTNRNRSEDMVKEEDLPLIEHLLTKWIATQPQTRVLTLSSAEQDISSPALLEHIRGGCA